MMRKLKTLFPAVCIFCSRYACYDDLPVCHKCIRRLHNLYNEKCVKCGNTPTKCSCSENEKIRFAFYFNTVDSRIVMYNFKYNTDKRAVNFLAHLLVRNCGINPKVFDGVTYVPRGKSNIKRYGYDQSKLLATAISELYGIPLITSLKRKKRKIDKAQKLLNIFQRKKSAYEKYEVAFVPKEKYKRILLVDDIITTGSTVKACSDMLRKNFSKIVTIAVLAKTNTFEK